MLGWYKKNIREIWWIFLLTSTSVQIFKNYSPKLCRTHFRKDLWAHDANFKNSCCPFLEYNDLIRSQFCTCHDSCARHVQLCDLIGSVESDLQQRKLPQDFNNGRLWKGFLVSATCDKLMTCLDHKNQNYSKHNHHKTLIMISQTLNKMGPWY